MAKFKLRTLLVLMALACLGLVIGIQVYKYRQAVAVHRNAYLALQDRIDRHDQDVIRWLLADEETRQELETIDPVNPDLALGRSVVGRSMSIDPLELQRVYQYSWQRPDGSRRMGVQLRLDVEPNAHSLAPHRIVFQYPDNRVNREVAKLLGETFMDPDHFVVVHQPLEDPSRFNDSTLGTPGPEPPEVPITTYGGIR